MSKEEIPKVYWTIKEVAEMIGKDVQTIRNYEKRFSWLTRSSPGHKRKIRRYDKKEMNSIIMIGYLRKEIGMSLKGIDKAYKLGYVGKIVELTSSIIYADKFWKWANNVMGNEKTK